MNWWQVLLFGLVIEGLVEATVYAGGYHGWGPRILGRFRVNYHLPMLVRWAVVCYLSGHIELLGAFAVCQDVGWHLFSWKLPARESWIGRIAGGAQLGPVFIPYAYPLGIGLTVAAYMVTAVV